MIAGDIVPRSARSHVSNYILNVSKVLLVAHKNSRKPRQKDKFAAVKCAKSFFGWPSKITVFLWSPQGQLTLADSACGFNDSGSPIPFCRKFKLLTIWYRWDVAQVQRASTIWLWRIRHRFRYSSKESKPWWIVLGTAGTYYATLFCVH
jgi:hypothetical protein